MAPRRDLLAPLLVLLLAVSGCGGSETPTPAETPAPAAPTAARPGAAPTFKGRVLSEDEVTRGIAVLAEVRKAAEARRAQAQDPSAPPPPNTQDLLSKHGFDQKSFAEVQQNLGRAYAVVKFRERAAQIEQLKAADAKAAGSTAPPPAGPTTLPLPAAYGDVPEENVTLVLGHRAAFEAATGKTPSPTPAAPAAPAPSSP